MRLSRLRQMPSPAETIAQLRSKCGAGFLDCKKALDETSGDMEKAVDLLRKKGLAGAAQRASRATKDGVIVSYIHHGGKVGVLLELNCETDFVAKIAEFQELSRELAMQVAAASPQWMKPEDVPREVVAKWQEIYKEQAAKLGKPAVALEKIVTGKMAKFYSDFCLLEQASVRDSSGKTAVKDMVAKVAASTKENITVRRFVRFQIGEET